MATSVSTQSGGIGGGLGRKGSSRPSTASGRSAGPTLNSVPPSSIGSLAGVSLPSTSSSKLTNSSAAVTVDAQAVKKFLVSLKKANILFDTTMHQDAHEMLNFLLNRVGEDIVETAKTTEVSPAGGKRRVQDVGENGSTCVHRLFEGILTNETRCLTCESVTSRDESFLDLSIDIDRNSSITSCLRQFSASEMLCARNKFFCDTCSGLQEAEKRMKIKKLPNVLALHLKRFKYEESIQRYVKLGYRVVFPFDLRLFNTSDDAENADRLYELQAIVVHIGAGPHHGHYIAIIRVGHRWCVFDDETISVIDDADISRYYGDTPGTGSAYVLFYQAV
ncbi:cysteine proteinase, partial [Acaromyces ingoldii]